MDIQSILSAIRAHHAGTNRRVTWERVLKTRKGVNHVVTKRTTAVVRAGINYDSRAVVIEGREDGSLPAENAGLPWGEWVEFPIHIRHKGADYIRLYPASLRDMPCVVEYAIDGVPATRNEVEPLCLASEFRKDGEEPLCFTVKAENIIHI